MFLHNDETAKLTNQIQVLDAGKWPPMFTCTSIMASRLLSSAHFIQVLLLLCVRSVPYLYSSRSLRACLCC